MQARPQPLDAGCIVRLIPSVGDNQHRFSGPKRLPNCSRASLVHIDCTMRKYLRVWGVRQHQNVRRLNLRNGLGPQEHCSSPHLSRRLYAHLVEVAWIVNRC